MSAVRGSKKIMKKIQIEDIEATDLGTNNYSSGMSAIVFDHKTTTVEQVTKLPNVFLHPLVKPDTLDIFAVYGTAEQFDVFYKHCVESYAAKEAFAKFGIPENEDAETWSKVHAFCEEIINNFVPWYEKSKPTGLYIGKNPKMEASLLMHPYHDAPDKFIVASGTLEQMKKTKASDYPEAIIISGKHQVAPCYDNAYLFKEEYTEI
jgi:hypothetical protein